MRYVVAILGVVVLAGALVFVKFKQISQLISFGKKMEQSGPPPENVGTTVAKEESWEGSLSATGSVAAVQGVSISNDAPGVVTKISFESGALVKKGDVLVELDSKVEWAQLASAKARRDLAQRTLDRDKALVAAGSLAGAVLDAEEAQVKTINAEIDGIQAQVARKIVRAPFAGRLGIRQVNVGQYLNPGSTLTVLIGVDEVFVDFALPQQLLSVVAVGMPVRITIEGAAGPPSDGTVVAIDPSIDAVSRTIKLRASVPNKDEKLHPGMFAQVSVLLPEKKSSIIVPVTALVHASYGDSVFIVENDVARQQFVKVGPAKGDFVSILDGVKSGQEVVTSGAFKLRNNSKVAVNNQVAPVPSASPQPENH